MRETIYLFTHRTSSFFYEKNISIPVSQRPEQGPCRSISSLEPTTVWCRIRVPRGSRTPGIGGMQFLSTFFLHPRKTTILRSVRLAIAASRYLKGDANGEIEIQYR